MRVLVTRPEPDAETTASQLRAKGHEVLISPLLSLTSQPCASVNLSGVQAILFTSANGVRAFAAHSQERGLPVFAVGPQTSDEAQAAGFAGVRNAGGDVTMLAEAVARWTTPGKGALLHASGADGAGR